MNLHTMCEFTRIQWDRARQARIHRLFEKARMRPASSAAHFKPARAGPRARRAVLSEQSESIVLDVQRHQV